VLQTTLVENSEHSAVVEHAINQGHCMYSKNTAILVKQPHYTSRTISEATEINQHYNLNREGCYQLSLCGTEHNTMKRLSHQTLLSSDKMASIWIVSVICPTAFPQNWS